MQRLTFNLQLWLVYAAERPPLRTVAQRYACVAVRRAGLTTTSDVAYGPFEIKALASNTSHSSCFSISNAIGIFVFIERIIESRNAMVSFFPTFDLDLLHVSKS